MNCDLVLRHEPAPWVRDEPFLLWQVGGKRVIEHWMDMLFQCNGTMTLWMEEPDARLIRFINSSFPLCQRCSVCLGTPTVATEACTFINADGVLAVRNGEEVMPALPDQIATRTWFAMVRTWLCELHDKGSHIPELEQQVQPGVFVGHHCRISRDARFIAPCWVGSGTTIESATIGPFAVVGDDCIVSDGVRMTDSCLLNGTYAGPGLRMDGLVATAGKIMEHRTGTLVPIPDNLMLRRLVA